MASVQYHFVVWSNIPSPTHSSTSGEGLFPTSPGPLFSCRIFDERFDDGESLSSYLSSRVDQVKAAGDSPVCIIQINKYTPAAAKSLGESITGFPQNILENAVYNTSTGQNLSVIPSAHKSSSIDIQFLMNYPFAFPHVEAAQGDRSTTIGFLPIGAWICSSSVLQRSQYDHKTMIFLICANPVVPRLLIAHYAAADRRRWARLQEQPLWIFADLLHVFGAWGQIWNITKRDLAVYHQEVHGYPRARPLLDLTRGLHNETAKILSVREQLQVHSSALTRFLHLKDVTAVQDLTERVQEHFEDISYHEGTSQVILRQLENMMSLAFNIETMTQGQAVARLNVLAFAFLPLSWVASIFGMTQFSISAVWYPLGAFIVLIITVLVPFILPVHGLYHYVLGLSAPNWLKKKSVAPALEIGKNSLLPPVPPSAAMFPSSQSDSGSPLWRFSDEIHISPPQFLSDRIDGAVQPQTVSRNTAGLQRKSSPSLSQVAQQSPMIREDHEKSGTSDIEAQRP